MHIISHRWCHDLALNHHKLVIISQVKLCQCALSQSVIGYTKLCSQTVASIHSDNDWILWGTSPDSEIGIPVTADDYILRIRALQSRITLDDLDLRSGQSVFLQEPRNLTRNRTVRSVWTEGWLRYPTVSLVRSQFEYDRGSCRRCGPPAGGVVASICKPGHPKIVPKTVKYIQTCAIHIVLPTLHNLHNFGWIICTKVCTSKLCTSFCQFCTKYLLIFCIYLYTVLFCFIVVFIVLSFAQYCT